MAETRKSDGVDKHVGERVRLRRIMLKMSQTELGGKIGVTFQQLQKYEKGANRIGASRLYQLAQILNVPPGFFFEGLPGSKGSAVLPDYLTDLMGTAEGQRIVQALARVRDKKVRGALEQLLDSIGSGPLPERKKSKR
jgi:transcriptional regulator with XRE-family HTH domain